MRLLTQKISSVEIRTARLGATLADIPVVSVSFEALTGFSFAPGDVPVGSVEFVGEAMRLQGIRQPAGLSYPEALHKFLFRKVTRNPLGQIRLEAPAFIKPVDTKLFTGFVLRPGLAFEAYDEHDQAQLQVLRGLPGEVEVYTCNPVSFLSEWRYYVLDGEVIGYARYDSNGEDGAPEPVLGVVHEAVRSFAGPAAYALDFGVLDTGETALVEANDGWALGLYDQCLTPREYLKFLAARWHEIAGVRS